MLHKFFLKFGLAVALVGLLVSVLGLFISGEFGQFFLEGGRFIYRTSFGSTDLLSFLSWFF